MEKNIMNTNKICKGITVTNNLCVVTDKPQDINLFGKNKRSKDGLQTACKICSNKYNDSKNYKFNKIHNPVTQKKMQDPNHKYSIKNKERQKRPDIIIEHRYRSEMKKEVSNKNNIAKPKHLLGISNAEFVKIVGKPKEGQALDHKVPVARLRKLFKHDIIKLDRAMKLINSYPNLTYMNAKANNQKSARLLDKHIPLYGLIIFCAQNNKDVNYLIEKYNKLGLNKIK